MKFSGPTVKMLTNSHSFRMGNFKKGVATLETLFGVALAAVLLTTINSQADFFADLNKSLATARYHRQIADAATHYHESKGTDPPDLSALKASGYLPSSFPDRNPYNQTIAVVSSGNGFSVTASGSEMPIHIQSFVRGFLGAGASVAGNTITLYRPLKFQSEDKNYLALSGGSMFANLDMTNHDILNIKSISASSLSGTSGTFDSFNSSGFLNVVKHLSASLIGINGLTNVSTSATANLTSANYLNVTSNTNVTGRFTFTQPAGPLDGNSCNGFSVGAIKIPQDKSNGVFYCNKTKQWKALTPLNFRVVASPSSSNTEQKASCGANEIAVSGGGIASGAYDENVTISSNGSGLYEQRWNPRHDPYNYDDILGQGENYSWVQWNYEKGKDYRNCGGWTAGDGGVYHYCQSIRRVQQTCTYSYCASSDQDGNCTDYRSVNYDCSYDVCDQYITHRHCTFYKWEWWTYWFQPRTVWSISKNTGNENDGNVKSNLENSRPVFENGLWKWWVNATQPYFKTGNAARAARAVCLCVGTYKNGTCQLEPSFTMPTSFENVNPIVN